MSNWVFCTNCNGQGGWWDDPNKRFRNWITCPLCTGKGVVKQ